MQMKFNFVVAGLSCLAAASFTTVVHAGGGSDKPYGDVPRAEARFVDSEGREVGQAALHQGPNGLLIDLSIDGLSEGAKAIHIHTKGTCADRDEGFVASGGHINPQERSHGLMNPEGPDAGDLPNFFVGSDGRARAQFFTGRASLDGSTGAKLDDEDGAAMVIHENRDDHVSQPIGGAGSRVACGVIEH